MQIQAAIIVICSLKEMAVMEKCLLVLMMNGRC